MMTNTEKLEAAVAEFLETSGLNIKVLQGFKLRAIVKHDPDAFGLGEEDALTAVNYYSTDEYLRRIALDAPTQDNDLFAQERVEYL